MPKAIDIHVHPPGRPGSGETGASTQMRQYFRGESTPADPEEFYQYYKDRDLIAVMVVIGNRNQTGDEHGNQNDWVAELQRRHPDTLIGFGGVDSANFIQYCNTLLQDRALWGSDYPALTPDRWLRDYETIPPFREAVAPKIFRENARKLLKLDF